MDEEYRPDNGSVAAIGDVDPAQVIDKAALLSGVGAFVTTDVPIPGLGVIKVKPLSRAQAMSVYNRDLDAADMEQVLISYAAVDPTFTRKEVARWQEVDTAGGAILRLVHVIMEISGMEIGAGKAAYKRFRGSA
jgi:predicted Zn-dependent peptidase